MNRLCLRSLAWLCTSAVLLWSATATAVPTVVPYAGYLTDADGAPYAGTVDVHAALYPCATAGDGTCDAAWTAATIEGVIITDGVLSFELAGEGDGPGTLTKVLTESADLWLEIAVLPEGEVDWILFEGRHRLQAVPYAIAAHDADHLGGLTPEAFVADDELEDLTLSILNNQGVATQNWVEEYTTGVLAGNATEGVPGYVTTLDLSEAIGDLVDFSALLNSLDSYVLNSSLTGALTSALEPYLLAADAYTDGDAIAAGEGHGFVTMPEVDALGYITDEDLPEPYTDADALAVIQGQGYASAADIPSHETSTVTSTANVNHLGDTAGAKSTTASFDVDAGIAKGHVRVDVQIRTELAIDHMTYSGTSPNSIAASVTHGVYLDGDTSNAPVFTDRLIHSPPTSGERMASGELKQYSYVLPLSPAQITAGTSVNVELTASCATDDAGYSGQVGCTAFITLEQITITGF